MRRHGYKGAFELAATVDYLFGYDATAGVVADWMYEQLADAYVAGRGEPQVPAAVQPVGAARHHRTPAGGRRPQAVGAPEDATLEALRQVYLEAEGELEETHS